MPFAVPMIWREPTCCATECYFCLTIVDGITKKNKGSIVYPNVPSAIRPVPHSENLPVPVASEILFDSISDSDGSGDESDFRPPQNEDSPQLFDQNDLDDLIRDLNLSKSTSEIL